MKKIYLNVACAGMDVHHKFSNVTFRDPSGKVVRRQRLVHPGRNKKKKKSRSETGQLLHPMVHALPA